MIVKNPIGVDLELLFFRDCYSEINSSAIRVDSSQTTTLTANTICTQNCKSINKTIITLLNYVGKVNMITMFNSTTLEYNLNLSPRGNATVENVNITCAQANQDSCITCSYLGDAVTCTFSNFRKTIGNRNLISLNQGGELHFVNIINNSLTGNDGSILYFRAKSALIVGCVFEGNNGMLFQISDHISFIDSVIDVDDYYYSGLTINNSITTLNLKFVKHPYCNPDFTQYYTDTFNTFYLSIISYFFHFLLIYA